MIWVGMYALSIIHEFADPPEDIFIYACDTIVTSYSTYLMELENFSFEKALFDARRDALRRGHTRQIGPRLGIFSESPCLASLRGNRKM